MIRLAIIAVAAITLTGCDLLDRIEGKPSAAETHHTQIAPLLTAPEPETLPIVETPVAAEPVCWRDMDGVLECQ